MKWKVAAWTVAAALAVGITAAARPGSSAAETAKVGQPVKDFKLRDLWTDKDIQLSQFKGKTMVLVFISYHCDTTWRYERRMGKMMQDYGPKGVVFLAVRSTSTDTADGIKKYCETKNLTMPLLYDAKDTLADYMDAQVTPTFYVIDGGGILRYHGSFDDNREEAEAKKQYLYPALDAVLAGKQVATAETRAFG